MKAAVCVVLLLSVLYQGEALRCNFCFSSDANLCTPTSIQTCSGISNACGAVILTGPLNYSFRQCMNMAVCQGFITTPGAFAQCCSTDLCN
ncbi:lymphocyte antigen 6D-like [Melanotaenia boesemani]|uniref:lymphocyte antigen 6D-like n=1 Tax=Melanotaenia boesemani TaxID=1250792 RepID=UPI001C03A874|nr:lymphocyte antigen 6D-like [Melanotaenia boesemani]